MKFFRLLIVLLVAVLVLGSAALTAAQGTGVTFFSTQFNIVEEAAKARTIFEGFGGGPVTFVPSEEGPMIDTLKAESQAGKGVNDVVGALHGTFPALVPDDLMLDQTSLLAEINAMHEVNPSLVALGKLGTTDFQYYVPWMQATYIMAARKEALEFLPEGADINKLTWEQVAAWAKNIQDRTGKPGLAFPVKGLFHRFLQGHLYPSFTGGMVTGFKSQEAADMFAFLRDQMWPYVNPESINYDSMGALLASGEVMLTWDHVARLKPGFDQAVADLVAFPSPSGPAGLGYMPVVVGVGVPATSPNPAAANEFIKFLLTPETQGKIMAELGFYPVVAGVDTANLPEGVAAQFAAVQLQGNAENAVPALLPVGLGARGGDLNSIYRNAFTRIVINKEDIMTALNQEGEALQKLLTETGAPCWAPDPVSEGPCQIK